MCGTHQSPLVELISQLKQDTKYIWKINFIGRLFQSPINKLPSTESILIQQKRIPYYPINPGKFNRHDKLGSLLFIPHTFWAIVKSYFYLQKIKPDIIVSSGGYASVPVIISGWILSIPSINHEQTIITTLAAKINSYFCTKLALSFDDPKQISDLPKSKLVITGNLLRGELFGHTDKELLSKWFTQAKPIIYITGGNQGSVLLNNLILKIINKVSKSYNVVHSVGKEDYESMSKKTNRLVGSYKIFDYLELPMLTTVLQKAILVISRAGANITQEIEALNKNAILIPLSSRKVEQTANAIWAQNLHPGQIIVLQESEANPESLLSAIAKLSKIPDKTPTLAQPNKHKFLNLVHSLLLQTDL